MIYMWFTGINYYKLAVEKDRDSVFTTITNHMETRLQSPFPLKKNVHGQKIFRKYHC